MALTHRLVGAVLLAAGVALAEEPVAQPQPAPDAASAPALEPPTALEMPAIPYPEDAPDIERPVQVAVNLVIDVDGRVREAQLVAGAGEAFDRAVLAGVALFRFTPARYGGVPAEVAVPFTHTFVPRPPPVVEGTQVDPTLTAKLHGLVLERGTRSPAAGALVVVAADGREFFATTDAAGTFSVALPAGDIEVRISSSAHRKFLQRERVAANEEVKVKYLIERQTYSPYETVVVGQRERTEISRTTLEGREIKHVPGTFGDPFRVVTLLPGVTTVMSLLPMPIVRGTSPGNTGFFLDQVRLPLLFHLLGGPAVVHPEFIERVDFYPGGFPVMYGGYTGGIVDGLTRAGKKDESRLDIDLNGVQTGVLWRHSFPSLDLTTTVAGRIGYPGVLLSLATDDVSLNYWDYQARVDKGGAYDGWTAFLFGASDELLTLATKDDGTQELQRAMLFRYHRGDFRYRAGTEDRNLLARFIVGYDETGTGPTAETSTIVLNPQLRASTKLLDGLRLQGGFDGQARYNSTTAAPDAGAEAQLFETRDDPFYIGGLFAELQWKPFESLLVVPGVRGDYYLQGADSQWNVDPRVMARWRPWDEGTWLKASVGAFHQPARLPIALPGLDISPLDLGLLGSQQASVGVERRLAPGVEIDVQAYFNWMDPVVFDLEVNQSPDDIVSEAPTTLPGQKPEGEESCDPGAGRCPPQEEIDRFFQPRVGRSYGLEVMLRKRDADGVFGWISYTLSRSERRVDGEWRSFDFDRSHILNLVAGMKLPRNWEIGGRLLLQTGTPLTTLSGYNASRSEGQMRFDLRIDKRAVWNEWLLDFYVDVINVVVAQESGGIVGGQGFRYVLPSIGFRAVL